MTGTHGRDRPVLADDGGVVVRAQRPLRLERHNTKGVTLDPLNSTPCCSVLLCRGGIIREHRSARISRIAYQTVFFSASSRVSSRGSS
jgi:hypothetical protein